MKVLIVVDMQNDFIDGALGTDEAVAIVPAVAEKIASYRASENPVIFTRDTHEKNYLKTQEGKNLPVEHCVKNSAGWQISSALDTSGCKIIDKPAFGSIELADYVASLNQTQSDSDSRSPSESLIEEIEITGLCTDICVISNALILKARLPETKITVIGACCAGVTPESHKNALAAMRMCQVNVI